MSIHVSMHKSVRFSMSTHMAILVSMYALAVPANCTIVQYDYRTGL